MKKVLTAFSAFALAAALGCSSTDTTTETTTSTAETSVTDTTSVTPITTGAGGRGTGISSTDMSDPAFLIEAASSGMMEVQLGQMAAQMASNPEVKKFGQMMVDHHSKANEELKAVAASLNVGLPTALTQAHQTMVNQLNGKTGTGFDEDYMDLMEKAHKRDIDMFVAKTTSAENAAVKDFAIRTLPVLRSHLEMADRIEGKVD